MCVLWKLLGRKLGSIMQEYKEAGSSVPTLWKCTAEWTIKVQREINEKHISTMAKTL